jgi:hypothetical protein
VPEFGFPLAMRPRFQLNAAIFKFDKWEPTSRYVVKTVEVFDTIKTIKT